MRSKRFRRYRNLVGPEITLTPLIDTALTLLVIFMLTAPMVQHAIKMELPKSSFQQQSDKEKKELVVSIDEKGIIYFNDKEVTLAQLGKSIKMHLQKQNFVDQPSVWLRVHGDTTTCTTLVAIIDNINGIGGIKDVRIDTKKIAPCA